MCLSISPVSASFRQPATLGRDAAGDDSFRALCPGAIRYILTNGPKPQEYAVLARDGPQGQSAWRPTQCVVAASTRFPSRAIPQTCSSWSTRPALARRLPSNHPKGSTMPSAGPARVHGEMWFGCLGNRSSCSLMHAPWKTCRFHESPPLDDRSGGGEERNRSSPVLLMVTPARRREYDDCTGMVMVPPKAHRTRSRNDGRGAFRARR